MSYFVNALSKVCGFSLDIRDYCFVITKMNEIYARFGCEML